MIRSGGRTPRCALTIAAVVTCAACGSSGDVTRVDVDAVGSVAGILFLDLDGGGTLDGADTPLANLRVTLGTSGSASFQEVTTDGEGAFFIDEVPVGTYAVRAAASSLGDSLEVGTPVSVTVRQGETSTANVGLSFPRFDLEEIGALEVGRRVFTTGIALNVRLPFGDGRVHLRGSAGALRAESVERRTFSTGDSLRLLGRTAVRDGSPVLEDVTVSVLVSQAAVPIPIEVTTATAAAAEGGTIDAELVRIRDARILDTATVAGDVVLTVDDGTGPLEVLLQAFQSYDLSSLEPDPVVRVGSMTGLLVPLVEGDGSTRWRLVPRGSFDISTRVQRVDVGLTAGLDFPVASRNDTVTYTIVAENAGPETATNVQVVDTLPPGFTLLDATPSSGTFDAGAGRWEVGNLAAEEADTLRLRARVSTELFGVFVNRVRVLPLDDELDTFLGNDVLGIPIEVVTPENKQADLRVRLEATDTDVTVGETFDLIVTALNAGPLKVSAVQILDSLPAGLELLSATPSRGVRDGDSGVWSLDSILPAEVETLRLRVRATSQAGAGVTVRARSLGTQRETDPVPANDSASVTISVAAPAPGRASGVRQSASLAERGDPVAEILDQPILMVELRHGVGAVRDEAHAGGLHPLRERLLVLSLVEVFL